MKPPLPSSKLPSANELPMPRSSAYVLTSPRWCVCAFAVEPLSVKHKYKGAFTNDMSKLNLLTVPVGPDLPPQAVEFKPGPAADQEIVYTYDVKWEYSDIRWASRWDLYLYMGDDQIHWFSILNSLAIVLLLTGIVAMIMMRTLRRDFNRYNEQDKEDLQEESGWKLVHAPRPRDPERPNTFPRWWRRTPSLSTSS